MEAEKWQQSIERWRKLPEYEKQAIRWKMIPRSVAASMAFAGKPVDLAVLEEEHSRVLPPFPLVDSRSAFAARNDPSSGFRAASVKADAQPVKTYVVRDGGSCDDQGSCSR